MKYIVKIIVITYLIFGITNSFAENKVVYIDMNKILNESKVGAFVEKELKKLVIFIHGDQLEKKVNYFDQFASKFTTPNSLVISITRPGWINTHNNKSDGKKNINTIYL